MASRFYTFIYPTLCKKNTQLINKLITVAHFRTGKMKNLYALPKLQGRENIKTRPKTLLRCGYGRFEAKNSSIAAAKAGMV